MSLSCTAFDIQRGIGGKFPIFLRRLYLAPLLQLTALEFGHPQQLLMFVCISLCTMWRTVSQNSSDNLPSYPRTMAIAQMFSNAGKERRRKSETPSYCDVFRRELQQ